MPAHHTGFRRYALFSDACMSRTSSGRIDETLVKMQSKGYEKVKGVAKLLGDDEAGANSEGARNGETEVVLHHRRASQICSGYWSVVVTNGSGDTTSTHAFKPPDESSRRLETAAHRPTRVHLYRRSRIMCVPGLCSLAGPELFPW